MSFNFGYSWLANSFIGWFGVLLENSPELGCKDSIIYTANTDGDIFISYDYNETLLDVFFLHRLDELFRGVQAGEIYAQKSDTIFYSADFAHSFDIVGYKPPFTMPAKYEIISGNDHAELYAAGYYRNWIESEYRYSGGSLEIWHSTDQGTTWDLIRHYDAAIHESFERQEPNNLIYTRRGYHVETKGYSQIYDINGKLLSGGRIHNLNKLSQGLLIIRFKEQTAKIVNFK